MKVKVEIMKSESEKRKNSCDRRVHWDMDPKNSPATAEGRRHSLITTIITVGEIVCTQIKKMKDTETKQTTAQGRAFLLQ